MVSVWRIWLPGPNIEITEYSIEIAEFIEETNAIRNNQEGKYIKEPKQKKLNHYKEPENTNPQIFFDTVLIELNSADTLDLQLLRGIGPWFASNIVKYRNLLGGFIKKEQLLEVYGMDSARYLRLHENVIVDTGKVSLLDLNHSSFKSFVRHPYFDYHIVKEIFKYKSKYGRLNSVDELKHVHMISDLIYDKISPYCFTGEE
jgi:DNA uptake protein ComE-like DNA-binding protein